MIAKLTAFVAAAFFALGADAIEASNRYRSPRNPERRIRRSTELIVLHTTEAPARSSLNKVSDRGECHFCVTEEGTIYRSVDRDKVAFHAGRSMWAGKEDVDEFSIGIECVGHHDKAMSSVQLRAIRDLVKELQSMYRIPDERVVCHSHVAYGAPNKWHRFKHRGRKRCGMLFAMPSVRRVLGLGKRPARDEDVRAGRLRNADDYLAKVLYGNADTMKSATAGMSSESPAAASTGFFSWLGIGKKNVPQVAKPSPVAKPPPVVKTPKTPQTASRRPSVSASPPPRTVDDLRARGYRAHGSVTKKQTASQIAGSRWNSPDTYYVIRGKLTPGNRIDPAHIELGMTIWMKKR